VGWSEVHTQASRGDKRVGGKREQEIRKGWNFKPRAEADDFEGQQLSVCAKSDKLLKIQLKTGVKW
jgi:hypothetical protein